MALGLCTGIQFIDLSTRRNVEQTPLPSASITVTGAGTGT
jgi:hypothetical protein